MAAASRTAATAEATAAGAATLARTSIPGKESPTAARAGREGILLIAPLYRVGGNAYASILNIEEREGAKRRRKTKTLKLSKRKGEWVGVGRRWTW